MVRKILLAPLAGALVLAAAPAMAQDGEEPMFEQSIEIADADADATEEADPNPFAMLAGMFAVEPLTAEQEARLPQANAIITKLVPEGSLGEMMGKTFDSFMKPFADLPKSSAVERAANGMGVSRYDLELTDEQAQEIADMFDPAYEEREAREMALLPEMMNTMMTAMEPPMRKAMAELYAINFTEAELSDIDAFFSTPTGAVYARKSFTMASDPRIVAATMEAMPALLGPIGSIEEKAKAATADLPPARAFAELTAKERARITALTGFSAEEIEEWVSMRDTMESGEWDSEAVTTVDASDSVED